MPASSQMLPEACRNRAKIFADDDGAMAMRFEGEQPQQIVERIAEIGALRGRAPCGISQSRISPIA